MSVRYFCPLCKFADGGFNYVFEWSHCVNKCDISVFEWVQRGNWCAKNRLIPLISVIFPFLNEQISYYSFIYIINNIF